MFIELLFKILKYLINDHINPEILSLKIYQTILLNTYTCIAQKQNKIGTTLKELKIFSQS